MVDQQKKRESKNNGWMFIYMTNER